jgi:hypothetical protein
VPIPAECLTLDCGKHCVVSLARLCRDPSFHRGFDTPRGVFGTTRFQCHDDKRFCSLNGTTLTPRCDIYSERSKVCVFLELVSVKVATCVMTEMPHGALPRSP